MKIGDVVTMNTPLTPERYGLGLIQKIVRTREKSYRLVYHILWPDGAISCQYDTEIILVARVK
jgi:hypothetical protein